MIHNGEIYNHVSLYNKYLPNQKFKTNCDSEVLIYLYEKFSSDIEKFCNLLDGIFSFAIVDGDDFLVARDPIGIKQLYYGKDEEGRYFFRYIL